MSIFQPVNKMARKTRKKNILGKLLAESRQEKQQTLEEVSAATGITKSQLSNLETSICANPTYRTLRALVHYYKLDLKLIFEN
jgi:transcriptional regulator with XRE-family HTH domain